MISNKDLNIKQLLSIMIVVLISVFVLASCDEAKEAMDDTTEAVGNAADKAGEVTGDAVDKAGEVAGDAVDKVGDAANDVADKAGEVATDVVDKAGEVTGDAVDKVSDAISSNKMVGVWTGKLDSRLTTLTITKQDDNAFEGKIVVNYRKPLNQDIKGSCNSDTKTITMADQLHSRTKGKYTGKLSDDGKTFSGTFTTLVDKKSYNYNLTKK